jgi:hypothetical protein
MKSLLSLLTLGALLVSPAPLHAEITRTVEKTFAVQPGGNFRAGTQGGDITIRSADINEVRIVVKQIIQASNEQEADKILKRLTLTLDQTGNNVVAEAKYPNPPNGWSGNWPPVTVSFEVTVPRRFNLNLSTSGGEIAVAGVQGNVRAGTSGGDLKFDRVDGEIDAQTSGGSITLKDSKARANLSTSGGDIEIDRAGGPTEATTSGGDVRVRVAKGAGFQLDAATTGGEVSVEGVTITTTRGGVGESVLVGRINGGGPLLKLRTTGGDISVRV